MVCGKTFAIEYYKILISKLKIIIITFITVLSFRPIFVYLYVEFIVLMVRYAKN